SSPPTDRAPAGAPTQVPEIPDRRSGQEEELSIWSTSAPDSPHSGSSAPASPSASWPDSPRRRSGATLMPPARSVASRSSSPPSPQGSESSRSSSTCSRSSSSSRGHPGRRNRGGQRRPPPHRRGDGEVPDQPVLGDHRRPQLPAVLRDRLD